MILAMLCMLSMVACTQPLTGATEPENTEQLNLRYTYNEAGQIATLQRFEQNINNGEWSLVFTVEYSYGEDGLLAQKFFYDEEYQPRAQVQTNTYTYTADGSVEQIVMQDSEGDLLYTITYGYGQEGIITNKTHHYSKLHEGMQMSLDREDKTILYTYSAIYYDETGAGIYRLNLFTREESVENASYTQVMTYYANGAMAQEEIFHNGILVTKITCPECSLAEGEEALGNIYLDSNTVYKPNGDGTYDSVGLSGTTTTYYQTGEIKTVSVLCENDDYKTTSYYISGQQESAN